MNTLLAKIDVKSAFRLLPVHPLDRHLLAMDWDRNLYIDTCLPFRLRSAPKLFNVLAKGNPNSSSTTNITIPTAFGLELQLLPLRLGYQTARSRCWDAGRVMPTSAMSKPLQRSLLSYQRNWSGTHNRNTLGIITLT